MPADDKLTLMQEARDEALESILEADEEAKAEILRPAIGKKNTKDERLAAQRAFLSDELTAAEQFDELAARFQLEPDTPIPVRFVARARQAAREIGKFDEDRDAKRKATDLLAGLELGRNGSQ